MEHGAQLRPFITEGWFQTVEVRKYTVDVQKFIVKVQKCTVKVEWYIVKVQMCTVSGTFNVQKSTVTGWSCRTGQLPGICHLYTGGSGCARKQGQVQVFANMLPC